MRAYSRTMTKDKVRIRTKLPLPTRRLVREAMLPPKVRQETQLPETPLPPTRLPLPLRVLE